MGGAFEVVPELGEIRVRANLDYEIGPRVCMTRGSTVSFTASLVKDTLVFIEHPGAFVNTNYNFHFSTLQHHKRRIAQGPIF